MATHAATIRLASADDALVMARMSRDLVEQGLGWRYSPARIARLMREADTVVVAAFDQDGLQGFAVMQFADEHAHLGLLCVQPDRQRRGIASALLAWLDATALVAGIVSVHLELRADNHGAEAFYRRLGYTPTVVVPGYYDGRIAARRMVRVLRSPPTQA